MQTFKENAGVHISNLSTQTLLYIHRLQRVLFTAELSHWVWVSPGWGGMPVDPPSDTLSRKTVYYLQTPPTQAKSKLKKTAKKPSFGIFSVFAEPRPPKC